MCMNCGCGEISERHGNQDNIVLDDVRRAATASGLDMTRTIENLQASLRKAGDPAMATSGAGGRSSMGTSGTESTSHGADLPGT